MIQTEPIDDYIEHQLIIQAKAKEIERLTLKKDWSHAFLAVCELQDACKELDSWLRRRINT